MFGIRNGATPFSVWFEEWEWGHNLNHLALLHVDPPVIGTRMVDLHVSDQKKTMLLH
jgi:hypothetical protein